MIMLEKKVQQYGNNFQHDLYFSITKSIYVLAYSGRLQTGKFELTDSRVTKESTMRQNPRLGERPRTVDPSLFSVTINLH